MNALLRKWIPWFYMFVDHFTERSSGIPCDDVIVSILLKQTSAHLLKVFAVYGTFIWKT